MVRQSIGSTHYERNLTISSADVTLKSPNLKGVPFETTIIKRYRHWESSVEESLIEMYLAGVSVRRVEDITEVPWGIKVSASNVSELNKKAYVHIEDWREHPLQGGKYAYVYVDSIYLHRNWGGEYENIVILLWIAVNEDAYRKVLGAAEGMKEDSVDETLTYADFPFEHWTRIRMNNAIKRLNHEIRRRIRVVGTFPDGQSALILVCAGLRHIAGTQWGNKKHMNMKHLEAPAEDTYIAG